MTQTVKYSIKTFIQTWYNKQKRDSELMTEKKNPIFLFVFLSSLKHTKVNRLHVYDGIKTGKQDRKQKTRGGEKLYRWVSIVISQAFLSVVILGKREKVAVRWEVGAGGGLCWFSSGINTWSELTTCSHLPLTLPTPTVSVHSLSTWVEWRKKTFHVSSHWIDPKLSQLKIESWVWVVDGM